MVKFESRAYMKSKIFFKTKNGAMRETASKNQIRDLNLNNRRVATNLSKDEDCWMVL
jgi:hypothetical protein